jgi:hypothetical protein
MAFGLPKRVLFVRQFFDAHDRVVGCQITLLISSVFPGA